MPFGFVSGKQLNSESTFTLGAKPNIESKRRFSNLDVKRGEMDLTKTDHRCAMLNTALDIKMRPRLADHMTPRMTVDTFM
jgi:hypothetical protein